MTIAIAGERRGVCVLCCAWDIIWFGVEAPLAQETFATLSGKKKKEKKKETPGTVAFWTAIRVSGREEQREEIAAADVLKRGVGC